MNRSSIGTDIFNMTPEQLAEHLYALSRGWVRRQEREEQRGVKAQTDKLAPRARKRKNQSSD